MNALVNVFCLYLKLNTLVHICHIFPTYSDSILWVFWMRQQWMCDCKYVLDTLISSPLARFPVGRLLNHMGTFNFFKNVYAAFHNGYSNLLSHLYIVQTFPSLHNQVITYLFILLIINDMRWYPYVILVVICIYLIVNNVGHFPPCAY